MAEHLGAEITTVIVVWGTKLKVHILETFWKILNIFKSSNNKILIPLPLTMYPSTQLPQ